MAGIIGGGKKAQTATRYQSINIQTSTQGVPIPAGWGKFRATGNIIWYGGFQSVGKKQSQGKGGGGSSTSYTYYCDLILAICEGTITTIDQVWAGTTITSLARLGYTLFNGSLTQTPWSYIEAKYPTQARAYAGTAYVAAAHYDLGSSPDLPNHNFEVVTPLSGTISGTADVNLADVAVDYLTSQQYGVGLASGALGDMTAWRTYMQAQGLFFSPYYTSQEQVTQTIQRWATLSNSWIFWATNQLKFLPLGDTEITANGVTYTPSIAPVYSLTLEDFLPGQGEDPVTVTRSDPADGYNSVQINIDDRTNAYNTTSITWKDQLSIQEYGNLQSNQVEANEIKDPKVAQIAAALIGKRSVYVRNTYAFKLSWKYILLEPGDIVTLTVPGIDLVNFPVRITSISEGQDGILTFAAEEFPEGIGTSAIYTTQDAQPNPTFNTQVDPGSINPPAIFEPNAALTNAQAQIWLGCSGGPNFGGADVYASFNDGDSYDLIGNIPTPIIQGILITGLPVSADPDTTHTLAVDLTISDGVIPATATTADADALRTLVLVDNEIMAYGTAAPAGGGNAYAFDMTYLRRGAYGSTIAAHAAEILLTTTSDTAAGSTTMQVASAAGLTVGQLLAYPGLVNGTTITAIAGLDLSLSVASELDIPSASQVVAAGALFSRIDPTQVLAYNLPEAYVGATILLKFLAYNSFGNAGQTLDEAVPYEYLPTGAAYKIGSPGVPTLTPNSATQSDGTTILSMTAAWAPSAGPLVGTYIIEFSTDSGTTWTSGVSVGASTTMFPLSPALENTEYLVRVAAVSQSGQATSPWVECAGPVDSGTAVTSAPAAPTGITATSIPGGAYIEWTASTSPTVKYYQVFYAAHGTAFSGATAGPTNAAPGVNVLNLTAGAIYNFWVTAVNGVGQSAPDGPASAVPNNAGSNGVIYDGVSYSTVAASTNITITIDGDTLEFSASTVMGVYYDGTVYSTLAPGTDATFTPSGDTLLIGGMEGPAGTNGTNGTDGTDGTDGTNGNTVLNSAAPPTSGEGNNGDFLIDTASWYIYGPKASGSWPGTGTSLKGPEGDAGPTGSTGPAGGGGLFFDVIGLVPATQLLFWYPFSATNTLAAGLPGAVANCGVAPTGTITMPIKKNGTTIGSVDFAASANTGTFTCASAVTFDPGDVLTVWGPTATDDTFATIGVNMAPSYLGEIVGVTFGGSIVNSIMAGANVSMSLSGAALTVNAVIPAQPALLMFSFENGTLLPNQEMFRQYVAGITLTLPVNLTGSVAYCQTAASSALEFKITVSGTVVGTVNFAAGATEGTFTFAAEQVISSGYVSLVAPASADPTFANPSVTLVGSR